ncbi:MAG TPA: protease HtpX [Elusimicrobiota bacterium]|nr:protease HtpX [Elusimicrobiota bacterium]
MMIKRIFLFLLLNLLVIFTIGILVQVLGLNHYLAASGMSYGPLLVICALYGFVGAFISLQISRWSAKRMMRIQLIDPKNPQGRFEADLIDKIKSLCQRAGLETLPEIGVYQSPEVNAFATGPSKKRALLAISSSLLNQMDGRAVEGVLGHEISHIANGDMVTMTLVQGLVNTFVIFFSQIIAFAIEQAVERDNEGGGLGFFAQFFLVMALESVLMFLTSPIIYWVSRRREYRADAGSAKLSGADTMIYALDSLKRCLGMEDKRGPALSSFKINGHGHGVWSLFFSTHPPLDARISALRRGSYA